MNSSFYSGIAVAISLGSLFFSVLFYFLDRKSKMKAEISYGTSVYGGYSLDSYLIIVTNLSNFRKYVQRFEYVVYNRYNIKKRQILLCMFPCSKIIINMIKKKGRSFI